MSYHDSDFATVEYDAAAGVIEAELYDFAQGESFREYMNAIIEAAEDTGCDKVIADSSEMGALRDEDSQWSVTDWSPRAEEAGIRHLALVMPESVIAEMSVERVVDQIDDGINRNYFDDFDAAKRWVRDQTLADYPA